MKRISLFMPCVFFCLFSMQAQHQLVGRTFIALVSESCHKMTGGGCMVYTYRKLQFEKDSVVVSYKIKASCVPKEREKTFEQPPLNPSIKKYKWSMQARKVTIRGFDEYGTLSLKEEKLLGQTKSLAHIGLGGPKPIQFVEEK